VIKIVLAEFGDTDIWSPQLLLDYAGVELQQGRVLLDADANELMAVADRRLRALASDTLGRATVSSTTPDAFKMMVAAGGPAR